MCSPVRPCVHLQQVHAHAKSSGLQVMGYYQANERADDHQLGPGGKKVSDVVAATLAPGGLRNHVAAFVVCVCIQSDV